MINHVKRCLEVQKYHVGSSRSVVERRQPIVNGDSELQSGGSSRTESESMGVRKSITLAVGNNAIRKDPFQHLTCDCGDRDGSVARNIGTLTLRVRICGLE